MGFRIFFAVLVFLNAYFLYQVIQQYRAHAMLQNVPAGYAAGPEDADLTIVEFFDYTCPLCRETDPVFREAIKQDGKIRYIPRPVIMDETSKKYANIAYAAGEQGKFMPMHDAIITDFRSLDETRKAQLAKTLGLDLEKLNKDVTSENVINKVEENLWLTQYYYTTELPQFVVGGTVIYKPVKTTTVEDYLNVFKQARGLR